ncbi:MAG: zinc ribbon domain-containing protein [Bacteroidales bacterium]|nr:zinc ribbon domain-containing protein [Bacteroidales bacterium]
MSNDFSTYDFKGKNIRIKRDKDTNTNWFVIVDVLSVVISNKVDAFWEKIKIQALSDEDNPATLFHTIDTDQGTIDIANLQQMWKILEYIPNRKAKKMDLWNWLNYPLPQDIIKLINLAISDGIITDTERNNIINKAEEAGIDTDDLNQYLDDRLNEYKAYQETLATKQENDSTPPQNNIERIDDNKRILSGCLYPILAISLYFTIFIIGTICHGNKAFELAFFIVALIGSCIIGAITEPADSEKNLNNISDASKKEHQDPIPILIREKLASVIAENKMTFKNKIDLMQSLTNNLQTNKDILENHIHRELKRHYRKFKPTDLQRCPHCQEFISYEAQECPFCGNTLIWQKVKGLTMLALSDRVLTDVERKTIVKTAIAGGIKPNEINEYLFNALNERLKTYTKVDLRDCPYCGAQIPLVSDECLYCGKPLEHFEGSNTKAFKITGPEADIILSENTRVEEERHNIKECPDCGAPFPLISNICPSCGHVLHERYENKLNIKNLLDNIMRSINRVNDAPKPKVHQILVHWFYYIMLIVSIFTFIMALIFDSQVGKVMAMTGFVASILSLIFAPKTIRDEHTSANKADGEYYKARYAYEMYARQVETLYGDDPEAKPLLRKFATAIKRLKQERYENRRRVSLIIGMIGIVLLGIITFFSAQKETVKPTPPPKTKVWNIPENYTTILNLKKTIKPFPPQSGVEPRLEKYLKAPNDVELTFVLSNNDSPTYHWKINKIDLISTGEKDTGNISDYSLRIHLLDSNFVRIGTLSESIVSELNYSNYKTIMNNGKGHYEADFWSEHGTNSQTIIDTVMTKAKYYTIFSNQPKPNKKKRNGR